MTSRIKWWINGIAAFIFVSLCVVYLLIRPIIVHNLEPVVREAAGSHINGTLSWDRMDLDPNYDLSFMNISLKDEKGEDVFKSPNLAIGWSMSALYDYAFNDGGLADVVKDITVEEPELHLAQKAGGAWNVESIVKPSDSSDSGTFTGRLIVKNGKASIDVPEYGTYDFSGVNTTLAWDEKATITGTFDGSVLDSHFEGDLTYTNTSNMEINLKTAPVSFKSLEPLLEKFPSISQKIEIDKGTGQVTSAKIWKSDGAVAYRVQGSIHDAALRYENYILADGAAFFDITDGHVTISDASLSVNGQRLGGSGEFQLDSDPVLSARLTLSDVEIEKLVSDYDVSGRVSGTVDLSGTLSQPFVSGEVTAKKGHYENLSIDDATLRFVYGENLISIPYLKGEVASGRVLGEGSYDRNTGAFEGEAAVEAIDLSQIPGVSAAGKLSGSVSAKGNYLDGVLALETASGEVDGVGISYAGASAEKVSGFGSYKNGDWNGVFYGLGASYQGISADTLSGEVSSKNGMTHISYLTGTSGEGAWTVKGDYGNAMDLTAEVAGIDMAQFASLTGVDMEGTLSGNAHVTGTIDNPSGEGYIVARGGSVKDLAFDEVKGHVSLAGGSLQISNLDWKSSEGNHQVTGSVGIYGPYPMNLTIKTDKIRIEKVLSLAELSYPVTGWVGNTMTITGDVNHPVVEGDFNAWDGSIMGELFQNISGQYTYNADGLIIKNGMGYIYDGTAIVNGTVKKDGIDMNVSLSDISMERMLPGRGLDGKVNMQGHVSGTADNPVFDGIVSSREIALGGTSIYMASTAIHYQNHVVSLDDGAFNQLNGQFTWKGSYNTTSNKLQGYLKFDGWNIKEVMRLFKLPTKAVDGTVYGGMRISGTMDNPSVDFKANFQSGHLGDTLLGDGTIDFAYMNGALSIREFRIPVGQGILAAEGSMTSDGNLDIQMAAKDMDISWVPQVLEKKNMKLSGLVTAAVKLSGNKNSPEADISFGVAHPGYGDISFDTMSLMANVSHNVVTIQDALIVKNAYKASAKGTLPGNLFTGSTTDEAVPLNVDINLDEADMNILALFGKAITSANGPIKGHVKVTGDYLDPQLKGGVIVKNGEISVATMGEMIKPVDLKLEFQGNRAVFDGSASFGGGGVSAKGSVDWKNKAITHYDGEAHIHTPSIYSTYFKGAIDGDFSMGEIMDQLGVEGTLTVHDATASVPLALFADSDESSLDFLTKIDVNIGDNVRLYSSALYDLWLKGSISMRGHFKEPDMTGRVNVEKGTVKLNTTEFKVDQANAVWGAAPGFLPVVHAKANTKVGHYAIGAEMDGPVGDMKTTFHSEPALNDSQILMLLTLHQDPNKDGSTEGALFNAGLTMLFGNTMQDFLQDKIGLDLISITSTLTDYYSSGTETNDDYYYIKIGKYLFNDFMLTATMGVNNEENSVGFHYDLTSRIGLSSWYNSKDDSYIGTDWNFKF